MPAPLTLHHVPADPVPWQYLAPCGTYVAGFMAEAAARAWVAMLAVHEPGSRDAQRR